jgi:hypothetical protein
MILQTPGALHASDAGAMRRWCGDDVEAMWRWRCIGVEVARRRCGGGALHASDAEAMRRWCGDDVEAMWSWALYRCGGGAEAVWRRRCIGVEVAR